MAKEETTLNRYVFTVVQIVSFADFSRRKFPHSCHQYAVLFGLHVKPLWAVISATQWAVFLLISFLYHIICTILSPPLQSDRPYPSPAFCCAAGPTLTPRTLTAGHRFTPPATGRSVRPASCSPKTSATWTSKTTGSGPHGRRGEGGGGCDGAAADDRKLLWLLVSNFVIFTFHF